MAIGNNREDQQSPMQQGASGIMGVGGPQAATGNATKTPAKRKTGTGFAGLQSYLTANPNSAQQETQKIQQEQQGVGQQIASEAQKVTGQIQAQKATGMGQQYKDVGMGSVEALKAQEEAVKNKARMLQSGDYSSYAQAQGYKPMTAGEMGLFGGMISASVPGQTQQLQQMQQQDAVGAALKGLAQTQDTQRQAFNEAVAQYQKQYNDYQTEAAKRAALENAARQQPSIMDRMRAYQQPQAATAPQAPVDQSSIYDGNSTHANIARLGSGNVLGAIAGAGQGAATTIKDVGNKTTGALKKAKKKIFG